MLNQLQRIFCRNRSYCDIEIDKLQLEKMQKQGAILLDVRSPQEFAEGHLTGAVLIPSYEIKKKAKQILKDKTKTIIVYCSSGYRSRKAQKILKELGYEKVYNI